MTRVLIVRLGALGDLVHALPAVAALRETFPAAEIDWVVEKKHRAFVDLVDGVSQVVPFDSRVVAGADGWHETAKRLRARRYDAVVDLQGLVKSAVLARAAGGRRTVGFARAALREPAARLAYTVAVAPPASARHVIDKNLALVGRLGAKSEMKRFPLELPEPRVELVRWLDEAGGSFAVLNPGAAWPNKRWPASRFALLARRLREWHQLSSVVLWGPGERDLARDVVDASAGAARAAPETTLVDLLHIARRAELFVAGDTGPLHLAAAMATPIVGIYGPTSPARNGPWHPDDICLSRFELCACHHQRRCRVRDWCLDGVSVDEVAAAATARLAAGGRR